MFSGKGKVVPVLNSAPSHDELLGVWSYRSTHS